MGEERDWSKLEKINNNPEKWLEVYKHYQELLNNQDVTDWWQEQFNIVNVERNNLKRNKLLSIKIDNFSEYIKKANKAREIPYIKGKCRLPKMYDNENYKWLSTSYYGKKCEILQRVSDGIIMISNKKSANKPRFVKVNGQDIYNQKNNSFSRNFLRNFLHDYFKIHLDKVEPFKLDDYPLTVEFLFYMHDEGKHNIDNDNKWVWAKGFRDTLTELKLIPDDNCYVISRDESETILIPQEEEQKLIINIYGKRN